MSDLAVPSEAEATLGLPVPSQVAAKQLLQQCMDLKTISEVQQVIKTGLKLRYLIDWIELIAYGRILVLSIESCAEFKQLSLHQPKSRCYDFFLKPIKFRSLCQSVPEIEGISVRAA